MNNTFYGPNDYRSYLEHHGVLGMKWGRRKARGNTFSQYRSNTKRLKTTYKDKQRELRVRRKNSNTLLGKMKINSDLANNRIDYSNDVGHQWRKVSAGRRAAVYALTSAAMLSVPAAGLATSSGNLGLVLGKGTKEAARLGLKIGGLYLGGMTVASTSAALVSDSHVKERGMKVK